MAPARNSAPYLYRDRTWERGKGTQMMFMAERGLRVEIHHTATAFTPQKAPQGPGHRAHCQTQAHTKQRQQKHTARAQQCKKQQQTLRLGQISVTKAFFCSFLPQELISPNSPGSVLFAALEQCAEPGVQVTL